ncbi:MAG: recombinase family protein, partial [Lachnospiraceae bacterium]|nr:recombinase family protein [Lachnospiraceae bacterium]
DEIPFLNMVTNTFLEGNYSLNGLETYFRKLGIKTLKGNYLSATQLYNILKNPHYAAADQATLEYFKNLGCTIGCDENKFTGEYGIIAYGRTSGGKKKTHIVNPPEKWIISVGLHRPIMTSEKWLSVQKRFGNNVFNKTRKHKIGILKGVLRCSCGYSMRVQHKVDKTYNKIYDNYFCRNRSRRGIEYCDSTYTSVALLDQAVIDILKNIALDKSIIDNYTYEDKAVHVCLRSQSDIQKDIDKVGLKINNLTVALGTNADSSAAKYLIQEIEKLDKELTGLKYELMEVEQNERKNDKIQAETEDKYKSVCYIVNNLETLTYDELNGLMKDLLKECVWDGVSLKIKL